MGDIPAGLIKYGMDELYEHLKTPFWKCTDGMEVPRELKTNNYYT